MGKSRIFDTIWGKRGKRGAGAFNLEQLARAFPFSEPGSLPATGLLTCIQLTLPWIRMRLRLGSALKAIDESMIEPE